MLALAGVALIAGCAQALKEPPRLIELAGGGPAAPPGAVDGLLAEAGKLFRQRDLEAVGQAARTWWRAAAADPRRIEGLIGAARAGAWITEHAEDRSVREAAAATAIHAAQWCLRIAPGEAACDYWLGAGLGVQARVRASTGYRALPEIEAAFKRAASAAPELEEAGPDRALALLYIQAPGWPAGPGDPELGLEHARKAVAAKPDFPPNLVALAEALAATGRSPASQEAYRRALDRARSLASEGHPDAAEWIEAIAAKLHC